MGKPTICICENKDADQLLGNREADQRLCFLNTDSTLPLLVKSKISSFQPASVTVQPDLCRTCSETTLLIFPRGGSYISVCSKVIVLMFVYMLLFLDVTFFLFSLLLCVGLCSENLDVKNSYF